MWNVDNLVICFFIYSILGYICEVAYCSIGQRRLVNRGFLFGPYLPIYGTGAVVVLLTVGRLRAHWYYVFLGGLILTSTIEYLTSFVMEKLFKVKLWDYSTYILNLNGRVCALNSSLFGIMSLFIVYLVHPFIFPFVEKIPLLIQHYMATTIAIILSIDTTVSVMKLKSFQRALDELRDKRKELQKRLAELKAEGKDELANEFKTRMEAEIAMRSERMRLIGRHIMRANPSMTARNEELKKQLLNLRLMIEERISQKKSKDMQ